MRPHSRPEPRPDFQMLLTHQVSVLDRSRVVETDVVADVLVVVVVVDVHWMRSCCFEAAAVQEFRKYPGCETGLTSTAAAAGRGRPRTDPSRGSGIRTGDGGIGGIADCRRTGPGDSGSEDWEGWRG